MRRLWIVLLFLFWGLVACNTAVIGTPTPFPTEAAVTPLPVANSQPIPLQIADLVATPAASQNAFIQLTGQYYRRPKLICETDPHPSPATWELAAGEAVALAGGFDGELRRLLPDGLTMTVEGHWLLWRGPVGCGKRAKVMDVWYLQVSRIIDPSPIAQVTLTPLISNVDIVASAATPEGDLVNTPGLSPTNVVTLSPTTELSSEPAEPTATLLAEESPQPTSTIEQAGQPTQPPEGTATTTPTVIITPADEESTPRVSATVTTEGDAPTGTPTATLAPGIPTNTPLPSPTLDPNTTATPTATPGIESKLIIQDELEPISLSKNTLGEDEIHAWPFSVAVTEVVTVTAVTADDVDLIISIVDEAGTSLTADDAPGGAVALIEQFELVPPGPYSVHVQTEDGIPAEYALILLFEDSLNFIFQPIIGYGASESMELPADSEHFWHFVGRTGDQISVTAVPDTVTDVFLELYGPDADRISNPFISVGGNGVTEQIEFTLPQDGLYSIRVGEWNFAAGTYQLTLTDN